MGSHGAFQLRSSLAIGLILSSIYIRVQARNAPAFLSIDCGSTSTYNDPVTNLSWVGDGQYIRTGTSGTVPSPVDSTFANYKALDTFTYFPDQRSKSCYDLPTTPNNSFNLRAMFVHGGASQLALPIQFDVTVNSSGWNTVTYDITDNSSALGTPKVLDGIFFSPGNLTHVCLVPHQGVAFISSLELRTLDPDGIMYSINANTEEYLSIIIRWDCGPQPSSNLNTRYPDDPYDRLWYVQDPVPGETPISGTLDNTTSPVVNNVPQKVMENAWANDTANTSFSMSFSFGAGNAYISVYVREIESNVSAGNRTFDVNLNEEIKSVTAGVDTVMVNYWNYSLSDYNSINFTGVPDSTRGPLVNAIEIYFQRKVNTSVTTVKDVDTLASLQESFNLTDWQGDPCYPVPWDWVSCTLYPPARVDKLLLSSMGLVASIPGTIIANLDSLTQIDLSNNSLYGAIPDSLASLPKLTSLYLNDNNLSGEVPPDLETKLGSSFVYSGNILLVQNSTSHKSSKVGVIVGSVVGGVAGLGIMLLLLIWYFHSKTKKPRRKADISITEAGKVSYDVVKIATDDFKTKIGHGSYGSVYRGLLNKTEVAVKVNNIQSQQGEAEFMTEVDILTRVHHRNLVSLIAYCNEGGQLILIYEYEANGTLREWLRGKVRGTLDWKKRLLIAADAARGLEYLHKGCHPTIIHRDVKSSNILLDEDMVAKVADFGLSKVTLNENTSGFSTGVRGTLGYLDPEYQKQGRLTHKSDVYSYGVVLAEIIIGRGPSEIDTSGSTIMLVDWIKKFVERDDIDGLIDPKLQGQFDSESMWRMAEITLLCVDQVGANRPDFTQIVMGINEAIDLENRNNSQDLSDTPSYNSITKSNYQSLIDRPG